MPAFKRTKRKFLILYAFARALCGDFDFNPPRTYEQSFLSEASSAKNLPNAREPQQVTPIAVMYHATSSKAWTEQMDKVFVNTDQLSLARILGEQ